MDDNKMNDLIKKSSEEIKIPESLIPENVEKKLEEQKNVKKKKSWSRIAARTFETAAVLAVVFFAGHQVGINNRRMVPPAEEITESGEEQEIQKEVSGHQEKQELHTAVTEVREEQEIQAEETARSGEQAGNTAKGQAVEEMENIKGMQTFSSTSELYNKLREYVQSEENQMALMARGSKTVYEDAEMMSLASDMDQETVTDTGASGSGYSQTNLREASVDEGDIIKTDGDYIYIMRGSSSVVVIDAAETALEKISVVEPEQLNESVRDLYVDGNKMILVTSGSRTELNETEEDIYETEYYDYVKVLTYDITDRSNIKLLGTVEQEGYYQSSRKNGQFIYTFTTYEPQVADTEEDSEIMPLAGGSYLKASEIYAPEALQDTGYLVAGAVDMENPQEMCGRRAIVSGADNFYVSGESIFIINRSWKNGSKDVTDILKFSYRNGEINGVGSCRFEGYLNDSFSADEYKGYLRAVVTRWNDVDEINTLYVFDEKMDMVGKIDDIAPGETIRSARFLGDVGYFVTFRQTDPLFSVDLSDPANPQISGELKVSGFSSYLHFYGEDRLLGIGYEADEETGITTGVKLSMFDISDPSNVTEIKRYVLKDARYVPALSNYKAIMIDPEKNLFGFVCDDSYMVFTFDEGTGFENLLTYKINENKNDGFGWYNTPDARGIYIGDTFYLMADHILRAFDMTEEFAQKEKVEF